MAETPKKWRKRRKTNSGDSTSAQVETDKENAEVPDILHPSPGESSTDKVKDEPEVKPQKETSTAEAIEEKPEPAPASKDVESTTTSSKITATMELPSSSSSVTHETESVEKPKEKCHEAKDKIPVKANKDVTASLEEHTLTSKDLPQKQTEKKSNILSKSSHFDFLANSIIITDVTTERGTITIKECSAYGDFFGPELGKS